MRGAAASGILAVWKRAAPRNRMRENFTSGSVGGLVEQSPILPGQNNQVLTWSSFPSKCSRRCLIRFPRQMVSVSWPRGCVSLPAL